MKVEVIGTNNFGYVFHGSVRIGQDIVIRKDGKVARVRVGRTKRYSKTRVSFDRAGVIQKGEASKKIISKGAMLEGKFRI